MVGVKRLNDHQLHQGLESLGFSPGPILPSTRKVYEKKLKELLLSSRCEPPVMNKARKWCDPEDSDDREELNIILKGNITLSKEKKKESQNRSKAFDSKRKAQNICCLDQTPTKWTRCATRSPDINYGCVTTEDDGYEEDDPENDLSCSLKLAILGIFIIVVFVYITVEKKSLFG